MTKTPRPARRVATDAVASSPLYQTVVKALRAEILRGVYPVGTILPSETNLLERFGVSRHTIRAAVRHLRDLGLVESHQGLGSVVLRPGGEPGETWLRIDGTRHLDVEEPPVCVVEVYLPSRFAGVGRFLGGKSGPIYALVETIYGESIIEVEQNLRALPATPVIAERLGLKDAEMVIEIRRVYKLLDGQTAEVTYNYYNAQQFNFSMNLRRVRD